MAKIVAVRIRDSGLIGSPLAYNERANSGAVRRTGRLARSDPARVKKFDKSITMLQNAQQQSHGDFWLNYERRKSLEAKGDWVESLGYARVALAIGPEVLLKQAEIPAPPLKKP